MSGRRDGSFVRGERLLQIAHKIAYDITNSSTRPKSCSFEEIVTWIQINIGLTEKKAREYVNLIVKAKRWQLNDGLISVGEVS